MRSSEKSLIHKSWRNDITWSEPILKALALAFAFAAWGLTLDLYQHMVTETKLCTLTGCNIRAYQRTTVRPVVFEVRLVFLASTTQVRSYLLPCVPG